jgi:acetyl-CoA C-acetyltransferase
MTIKRKACIAGAYEHPTRKAPDKTVAQLHAECARGALADAGLSLSDVDGYFCGGDAPGLGALSMADYMGLRLRHVDSTDTGGSAPLIQVAHAAQAIATGRCNIALITMAGRPRSENAGVGVTPRNVTPNTPDVAFEMPYNPVTVNMYALAAARHMFEYGTTSEQLAWIKVAATRGGEASSTASGVVIPKSVPIASW